MNSDSVTFNPRHDSDPALVNVGNSDVTRSEVRQFLVALSILAFVLSSLGLRDGGPMAFAADIVLVLCGGWCANQLIRGLDVLREQVICVLQAYFTGLFCCSVVLFAIGWMVFLPSEFLHLGHTLLFASTFTTNLQLALIPVDETLRFQGLLSHLWVPALVAQCCGILALLYWFLHRHAYLLLGVLAAVFVVSLSLSSSESPIVHLLPIGGLWAFVGGAIPFFASNSFPVVRFALLLGIISLLTGILAAVATGDTLFARAFLALSFAFLYLGSRARESKPQATAQRRRWFGMGLHMFLWSLPLAHVASSLNISDPNTHNFTALMVPSAFLALVSWSIWQQVEKRVALNRIAPTGVIALLLMANGITTLTSQGLHLRFSQSANAYIHAIETSRATGSCPVMPTGPLAGLNVCTFGPDGPPEVLIWGDHQLTALKPGYEEAAQFTGVPTLLIAEADCVPLDGLQTRYAKATETTGRGCDQHSAQILQALPHLDSIKQVTIVADWLYYTGVDASAVARRAPVRLGPMDGSPINMSQQPMYVARAVERTVQILTDQGLRVSLMRQVPAHPKYDAEIAARAEAPGHWLYQAMPRLSTRVPIEEAIQRHAFVDEMLRHASATENVNFVDTWDTFCSSTHCSARGGLSTKYVSSTLLTPSGALALCSTLAADISVLHEYDIPHEGTGS